MLVGVLGIVIGSMQISEQPATVAQIDSLLKSEAGGDPKLLEPDSPVEGPPRKIEQQPSKQAESASGKLKSTVDLSQIEDNTYFRPEENEAWFAILEALNKEFSEPNRWESVGDVTYAQFLAQPDVYRGKLATVRGKVLREELLDAPPNDIGIKAYHRLVIRPVGGGVWPIIVYCLELPQSFPQGDKVNVDVVVQGIFFKNWSYAWEEGLGLAPVLLAKTVNSHAVTTSTPVVSSHPETDDPQLSESVDKSKGSFRDILQSIGLDSKRLSAFSTGPELTDADWQILSQLFARFSQYNTTELEHWVLSVGEGTPEAVGDLRDVNGIVFECAPVKVPAEFVPLLGLSEIYRCQVRLSESQIAILYSAEVPNRWKASLSLSEPITSRAVLLRVKDGKQIYATKRVSWFPNTGIPSGQLLLAQNGMDVALWDTVKQRGEFVSPETSREAEAFYSCLAALELIPTSQLSKQISHDLEVQATTGPIRDDKVEQQIADAVSEQAELGLSSVVPLFLAPESQVGELVRLEGIARRAVRIVGEKSDNGIRDGRKDFYELELFTPDSQNLPIVCCVNHLPTGFPMGDEIREQVRIEGVFFKSWRYRSRKLVEGDGETNHQQQRYTPIVLAGTVTWIQEVSTQPGWWGLAAGIGFLILLAAAWVKLIAQWRKDRRPKGADELIDLPNF